MLREAGLMMQTAAADAMDSAADEDDEMSLKKIRAALPRHLADELLFLYIFGGLAVGAPPACRRPLPTHAFLRSCAALAFVS